MLAVNLPKETEERLNRLAKSTGRTKSFYLRELIDKHLDELEDVYLAEQVLERIRKGEERTFTLDEVEARLDLAG
jgi:RHH-type rel operon transcriptional repressor/antitoxin RelB